MNANEQSRTLYKVILVGEPGVGKTSFAYRVCKGHFSSTPPMPTMVSESFEKIVTTTSGAKVTLDIWDTAGQERFHSLSYSFYRGAAAVVVVYDVENKGMLNGILREIKFHLYGQTSHHYSNPHLNVSHQGHHDPLVFLLGTKTDLIEFEDPLHETSKPFRGHNNLGKILEDHSDDPVIVRDRAVREILEFSVLERKNLSDMYGVPLLDCFLVSSKTGENVEESVKKIAESLWMLRHKDIQQDDKEKSIRVSDASKNNENAKDSGCSC